MDIIDGIIHFGIISNPIMPSNLISVDRETFEEIVNDNHRITRKLWGRVYVYSLGREDIGYYDRREKTYKVTPEYAAKIKLELEGA